MGAKVPMAVMAFHSTTDALAFGAAAKEHGLAGRFAPIPRQMSAGCGMAWREPISDAGCMDAMRRVAQDAGIEYEQLEELLL